MKKITTVIAGVGIAMSMTGIAHADPIVCTDGTTPIYGRCGFPDLDAAHGGDLPHRGYFVAEDDPEFDCRIDGDQICGLNNSNGVAMGMYGIPDEDRSVCYWNGRELRSAYVDVCPFGE